MHKFSFRKWNEYLEYFKEALDSGVLRIQDASSFAWSLYTSSVICLTKSEYEEVEKRRSGIIKFMQKLSDSDYTKEHNITSENIGALYEQELAKATTPEVKKNSTSYTKRSSSR